VLVKRGAEGLMKLLKVIVQTFAQKDSIYFYFLLRDQCFYLTSKNAAANQQRSLHFVSVLFRVHLNLCYKGVKDRLGPFFREIISLLLIIMRMAETGPAEGDKCKTCFLL
jgi:hypothetical protein